MVVTTWNTNEAKIAHYASRLHREVKLLERALDGLNVEKSLEVGCGYGRLTPWIKEHSQKHFAVEPEDVLRQDAEILNPDVTFRGVKAQELPFPDNFFDLVITWTVLQHIPTNEQIKAIEEIKRVAKASGVLIITEGIGTRKGETEWLFTLDEYKKLFSPFTLTESFERVLEETAGPNQGLVMRYERR
jgi:ubiquinone/menaquinone biosynthesis C-methylase UbiE